MHQNTPNLNSNIYFNTLGLPWGPKFSTGGGRIFFGVNGHFLWFRWLSYGHKKTMGMVVKKFFDRTQLSPYPTCCSPNPSLLVLIRLSASASSFFS